MTSNLHIRSLNCRGLGNRSKRLDIFSRLKDERADIILLQDTHWDSSVTCLVREEWNFTFLSTEFSTRSRGTAILFNNSFEFTIGQKHLDDQGNFCITEVHLPDKLSIVIGSIYAPNQDTPEFITELGTILKQYDNPNIILGGDWNSTRNYNLDNFNYLTQNHPRTTRAITDMCNEFSLEDGWRVNNLQKRRYTWLQGITNKQARLDFFLCSDALLSISTKFKISPKYRSDHAPISFCLQTSPETRGRGTWKMNNDLLKDSDFVILIKKSINDIKRTYILPPFNPETLDATNRNLNLSIPPTLFWETLLVTLRGTIISYSSKKKRQKDKDRKALEKRISQLDEKVISGLALVPDLELLLELNNTLVALRREEQNGSFIRSRAEWTEYGEKPSKFFLNLETKNRVNKNISEIKLDENHTLTKQDDILNALHDFYRDLYRKQPKTPTNIPDPILNPVLLTPEEKAQLELPISKHELDQALTSMKNNKSPGMDGYSPEFFKKFWDQLGWFFLESINESFANGHLTESQTQGIITCIPKSGKARNLLQNWRPISLLNTSYKLISLCITNRLRKVLNRIISPEQKGFLEGRTISDCTRIMFDIIHSCQTKNIDGLILLVDFQKAFDSLSWDFINETLTTLNFGNNFIKWINIFQKNSNSRVLLNGHLTNPFPLERGCRQGDPISPYLFILCSEFLTLAFKQSNDIEGITIHQKEHRLSQYADDTSAFLKASEQNLRNSLKILEWFFIKSGLKINMHKTKVIRIGPIRETDRRFCRENNLDWVTQFTALGIDYDVLDLHNITELNISTKINSMKRLMQYWSGRNISPIGRITIFKSLILSKIIHVLQSLPSPSTKHLNEIEKMATNFVWRNKRHQVNKKVLCQKFRHGGLDMINLKSFDYSLKIAWITKLQTVPEWLEFATHENIDRLIWTDITYHAKLLLKVKNPFWSSVIQAYTNWYATAKTVLTISSSFTPIWGNPDIKIPFNNVLFKNNILFLQDLFDNLGNPLTKIQMENQIGEPMMLTTYFALWKGIPSVLKDQLKNVPRDPNLQEPPIVNYLKKCKKGTSLIRHIWETKNVENISIGQRKWSDELTLNDVEDWEFIFTIAKQCHLNANITFFHFQVIQRTIMTNKKMHQFNLRDNDLCDECQVSEDITHLLFDCPVALYIWETLHNWLFDATNKRYHFDKKSILLSNKENGPLINTIILLTKHELYKKKWKENILSLQYLKQIFKRQMQVEIYNGTMHNRVAKILGKWSPLHNTLINL